MTNKYECIVTCVGLLLVAALLAFAVRSCTEYSVRRMELGYPETGSTRFYPQRPTNCSTGTPCSLNTEQPNKNADIPLPGGDSSVLR